MTKRSCLVAGLVVSGVSAIACVQHPVDGVDDAVNNNTTPWTLYLPVSGAYASTDDAIVVEAAIDKASTSFEEIVSVRPSGPPIVSPGYPTYYVWSANLQIPEKYWRAGHGYTAGYKVVLRARAKLADGSYMALGSPHHPASPALCWAFKQDPNAFPDPATTENACSVNFDPYLLQFEYHTANFNDACGGLNEACCTDTPTKCNTPDLQCASTGFCVSTGPDAGIPDAGTGKSDGGTPDAQCVAGATQVATTAYFPPECPSSFSVAKPYQACHNGTWGPATASLCNANWAPNTPAGNQCYCNHADGVCGTAAGQPCIMPNKPNSVPCVPGYYCDYDYADYDPGATGGGDLPIPSLCFLIQGASVPKCWNTSDVKPPTPPGNGGSGGGGKGGAGGGSGGSSGAGGSGSGGGAGSGNGGSSGSGGGGGKGGSSGGGSGGSGGSGSGGSSAT